MTGSFERSWEVECHYEGEDGEDDGDGRSGDCTFRGDPTPAMIQTESCQDLAPICTLCTLLVMAENLSKVRARTVCMDPIIDINLRSVLFPAPGHQRVLTSGDRDTGPDGRFPGDG